MSSNSENMSTSIKTRTVQEDNNFETKPYDYEIVKRAMVRMS